jgi:tetratricopeptide (TPR) repeat protein
MSSSATTVRPDTNPWIFQPSVDLLIGCGAWSLPLLAITFYLSQRNAVQMSFVFYFLGVFCNQPHYMATVYRAYRTPYDFNRYRFFTVYVTVFIGLTVFVAHLAPAIFPWLLTFYLTWSPWHYSGQNFGISMMLARRAGARPTNEDRNLIWWSYLASYGVWFLALHNSGTAGQPNLIILPIPQGAARLGELFFLLIYLAAGGLGHGRLVRQVGLRAMAGPLTMFATQFLWFLLPEVLRVTTNLEFPATYSSAGILAFMHCAQYLWITSYFARKERLAAVGSHSAARNSKEPGFRFLPYYLVLILGGIALFTPGPWLSSRLFGHDLVESFFIFAALINLHHFILDGAIWKLRDGRIARLLLGRNPPIQEPDQNSADADTHSSLRWLLGRSVAARATRYSLAALLLGIAFLDQTQFWLTLKTSGQPAFALAQLINPQDTRVYFQRARQLVTEGKSREAMEELRHAIAINPRNAPAQHLLGELLFKSGDTKAALEHYDRMAVLFRPDYVTLINSGLLASQRGDTGKALQRFEAALHLTPHDSTVHLYLGQALETSGDLPAAARQYALYIRLHDEDLADPGVLPNYLRAGMKLAELSLRGNRPKDAIALYRRIIVVARENGKTEEAALAEANLRNLGAAPAP